MHRFFLLVIVSISIWACSKPKGKEEIVYSLRFTGTWNAVSHPDSFPQGASFSPIAGMIHNANTELFSTETLASNGIIALADSGNTDLLVEEMLLTENKLLAFITGRPNSGTASIYHQFRVDETHHYLSFASKITPSPDWFVGINKFDLKPNGTWIEEITLPLIAYDAGIKTGNYYQDSIETQVPQQPIHILTQEIIKNEEGQLIPFGAITLKKFVIFTN